MSPRLALLTVVALGALRAQGGWGVAATGPAAPNAPPRPPIVVMHGMWSSAEEMCGLLEPIGDFGVLVCPRGNAPLGDGRMWTGGYETVAPVVHLALQSAAAVAPGGAWRAGGALVGYSNGAYFAAEVAQHEPGRWTGLVLLSMRLDLSPARLQAAGIRRVVVGAADRDASRAAMVSLGERLGAGGLAARFVSLGPGGHELSPDLGARLRDAVAWAAE